MNLRSKIEKTLMGGEFFEAMEIPVMSCQDVMSLLEQLPGTSEATQEACAGLDKIKPGHFHGKIYP